MLRFAIPVLLVALTLGVPANADHCVTWSNAQPEVDTSPVLCPEEWLDGEACSQAVYVDNDLCQIQCLYHVNVYCEYNGIAGLQREDERVDNTCHGIIVGDVRCV